MDKIKFHIPYLIVGILCGIIIVVVFGTSYVYLSGIGNEIHKIYGILDTSSTCYNN